MMGALNRSMEATMQFYSDPKRENDAHALPDMEVFYFNHRTDPGWYWWACFPGCLPDGDAMGPFDTEGEAIDDARS